MSKEIDGVTHKIVILTKRKAIINLTLDQEKKLYELLRPLSCFTIKPEKQAVNEKVKELQEILGIEFERI